MHDEYIPVYVSEVHLPAIHSLLASLLTPTFRVGVESSEWSSDLIERLFWDAAQSTRQILVALAKRQGEWVTAAELLPVIGKTEWRSVSGALSPITKRMKAYGQTAWPFQLRQDPQTNRYSYRMGEATANVIVRLNEQLEAIIGDRGSKVGATE